MRPYELQPHLLENIMVAYAVLVTFVFGCLVGSCLTVIAAIRMEGGCCPFCTGSTKELLDERREAHTPSTILNYGE